VAYDSAEHTRLRSSISIIPAAAVAALHSAPCLELESTRSVTRAIVHEREFFFFWRRKEGPGRADKENSTKKLQDFLDPSQKIPEIDFFSMGGGQHFQSLPKSLPPMVTSAAVTRRGDQSRLLIGARGK
jgi:hypothetical protein